MCGWGPYRSPAHHHPFLPSFPCQSQKARIKPPGCPFHSSERGGDLPGSQSRARTGTHSHPGSLSLLVLLGEWDCGATGFQSTCLPTRTSGLWPTKIRWAVGGGWLVSLPVWGPKHNPLAPAGPTGLRSCSSTSQLCGLGQVSLPLCACFLIYQTASSLSPPHRVCDNSMGYVRCSTHRAENK